MVNGWTKNSKGCYTLPYRTKMIYLFSFRRYKFIMVICRVNNVSVNEDSLATTILLWNWHIINPTSQPVA